MSDIANAIAEYGYNAYAAKQALGSSPLARRAFELACLARAAVCRRSGNWHAAARHISTAVRLLEGHTMSAALRAAHRQVLAAAGIVPEGCGNLAGNRVLGTFLRSADAAEAAQAYGKHGPELASRMKFPRPPEDPKRQGNLIMLKPHDPGTGEKGVLYLQYTESIRAFVALFDLQRLAQQFRLVLEPSSWGYQDESFLLLAGRELGVIVQAQDEVDYEYIANLECNLVPLRLGAGDWIDPATFTVSTTPTQTKEFDFVMVASWSPVKRHRTLFAALSAAGLREARVALVGYPWDGVTRRDIEGLARNAGLTGITIFERIPREQVADIIRRSKVGVMLSRREGANRGIYECMFCDVPVIVPRSNRGVNKSCINSSTGRLFADDELPSVLIEMLQSYRAFSPRAWAAQNTGYQKAWITLNSKLESLAKHDGEPYTQPIVSHRSAPAAVYASEEDRLRMVMYEGQLQQLLRPGACRNGAAP